ncbi:hypothetical protein FXF53_18915 [Micromonospora sp. WP24]|uniref:hypothetical protein n=1 Tax=Micromonospora TaxID=1873 RepID=UPI0011D6FBEB|nr:hypothetical protein [Micromonospora sp. WP24]TYB97860.1 hypothetical protein FXF53_18915 [Micromonospora sp. WP24]
MAPDPRGTPGSNDDPDAGFADFSDFDFDDFRGGQQLVDPEVPPPTATELPEPVPPPVDE